MESTEPGLNGEVNGSNYILSSSCDPVTPITGLEIDISVTKDIVCENVFGPSPDYLGCGFQLNANSVANPSVGFQQYVIIFYAGSPYGPQLFSGVNNWQTAGNQVINSFSSLCDSMPPTIPAGYNFSIYPQSDSQGNIISAKFFANDNLGNQIGSSEIDVLGSAPVAPIIDFELDFVGPINGESAVLSSGAGFFTYLSGTLLTPSREDPSCAAIPGTTTLESANTFYGALPATPANILNQSFSVLPVEVVIPNLKRKAKPRPALTMPTNFGK